MKTKKYWLQALICSLIILISVVFGIYYYREYIKPHSYVLGTPTETSPFTKLALADYISNENVLFSQDLRDCSFGVDTETKIAKYEFNFEHVDFNGLTEKYLLCVNDYIVSDITIGAGTISAKYPLTFYDVNNEVLCSTEINLGLSFYSLGTKFVAQLPSADLGYFMKYLETDNFIVSLTKNVFGTGEITGSLKTTANVSVSCNKLGVPYTIYDSKNVELSSNPVELPKTSSLKIVLGTSTFSYKISGIDVASDGQITKSFEDGVGNVSWTNATYVNIVFTVSADSENILA